MQALRSLTSIAINSAHSVGPWLSIVALSGSLAFAFNNALGHGELPPLADTELRVTPAAETVPAPARVASAEPSMRWVSFSSTDRDGVRTNVACLTTPDRFGADSIELDPADMDRLTADLQCWPAGTS